MSPYFLGVDIGGTKSHALIADGEGNAVGFGTYGPGNHEEVGYEGLRIALSNGNRKSTFHGWSYERSDHLRRFWSSWI